LPPITLHESETVVAFGYRKVVWFIWERDRYRPAATWPGACVKNEQPRPGTVWERHVGVSLDVGTRLMQLDSRPNGGPARDVMDYLRRETRKAERETHRSYYEVDSAGRLIRSPPDRERPRTRRGTGPHG